MALKGPQYRQVVDALLDAFPAYDALAHMVKFGLGLNLERIASSNRDMTSVAFDLVQWAESHGRLDNLLDAALNENPHNPLLQQVSNALGKPVSAGSSHPAPQSGSEDAISLYDALCRLLPAQFDELVMRLGISNHHLSGPSTPLATRAGEVVRLQTQQGPAGLKALKDAIDRVTRRAF